MGPLSDKRKEGKMTQGGRKAAQDIEDDEVVPLTEEQIAWLKKWHAATGRDGAIFETLNDLAIDVRDHRGECRGLLMQVELLVKQLEARGLGPGFGGEEEE